MAAMNRTQTRSTRQRRAILEAIRSLHAHPTADEVFFEVRKRLPRISLGTVYRNLNVLVQQGTIAELSTVENVRRYDEDTVQHAHIACTECGRISDVIPPSTATEEIIRSAAQATGYRVEKCHVELTGLCPTCRNMQEQAQRGREEVS